MIFGAQYFRPPFPTRDCWQRDFQAMQANGFNTVKLWAVWNWIEKVEGVYDFDELDELVELADRYGLKVILNLIPEGAPYWVLQNNQDALYTTARGETVTFGGPANLPSAGWPGFCWDSPQAQLLMEKFIEVTAAHFRNDKSVIAIDVWNEPHLEPMFDYKQELLC
jgi:aryl-phospho-beta-D-glucosidase BglC (GH1 family)